MTSTDFEQTIQAEFANRDPGEMADLKRLLKGCPNHEDLTSLLKTLYLQERLCVVPGDEIADCIREHPSINEIFIKLATQLYPDNRLDQCEQILKAVVSGDPVCVEAWNDLGVIAFTRHDFKIAEECFNTTLTLDPHYGDSILNLTALYMATERPDQALKIALRSFEKGSKISQDIMHEIARIISNLSPKECADNEELHGDLLYFLLRYKKTHKENLQLNKFEIQHNIGEVRSYPLNVYLNMTNVCNVNCGFCAYNPDTQTYRDFVTLKDIQKMTWLRYAKRFGIWTGVGDSLVNSEFRDIYLYLVKTFPHLEITLSTNGLALNDQLAADFAGTLDTLNISLNAAKAETYHKVMNRNHFDRIVRNMKAVVNAKRKIGAEKPYTVFSYVICKENVHETPRFIEICHELGVDLASFKYFISPLVKGRSKISEESSCYRMKEESDACLREAYRLGEELGVQMKKVPLLVEEGEKEAPGMPPGKPTCLMPWTECHLGPAGNDGKRFMFFCCTGLTKGVVYDQSKLDSDNFMNVWNHPDAQYTRTTVNGDVINSACRFCLYKDWVDPDSQEKYDRAKMK